MGIACSVTPETYAADQDRGSTQAVVAIARQEDAQGTSRGDALAGFLRLPAAADRSVALELAGLGVHLPEPGHCWQGEQERPSLSVDDVGSLEFLEAGRVRLLPGGGPPHELAPHAFPSVGDLISGVLYASRERSAEGLPPGVVYRLEVDGGAIGSLDLRQAGPPAPSEITVSGAPFESLETLPAGQPLDLIWSGSSDPHDRLYVELSPAGGSVSVLCTFEDAAGAGTVPVGDFASGQVAHLALHRLRVVRVALHDAAVAQVELRFDFSVSRSVEFE